MAEVVLIGTLPLTKEDIGASAGRTAGGVKVVMALATAASIAAWKPEGSNGGAADSEEAAEEAGDAVRRALSSARFLINFT